jgi:hypothetical protein
MRRMRGREAVNRVRVQQRANIADEAADAQEELGERADEVVRGRRGVVERRCGPGRIGAGPSRPGSDPLRQYLQRVLMLLWQIKMKYAPKTETPGSLSPIRCSRRKEGPGVTIGHGGGKLAALGHRPIGIRRHPTTCAHSSYVAAVTHWHRYFSYKLHKTTATRFAIRFSPSNLRS